MIDVRFRAASRYGLPEKIRTGAMAFFRNRLALGAVERQLTRLLLLAGCALDEATTLRVIGG